jgi:hypothetical protein
MQGPEAEYLQRMFTDSSHIPVSDSNERLSCYSIWVTQSGSIVVTDVGRT